MKKWTSNIKSLTTIFVGFSNIWGNPNSAEPYSPAFGKIVNYNNAGNNELEEAQRIEEENDYSDAMESMERKYWEGQCDALGHLYELTIRDLPFGEQALYPRINRRQMRCEKCGKKFTEELNYLPKKRTYTDRFRKK